MEFSRFIYFKATERFKLPDLAGFAKKEIGGASALEVNGERRDINDQVNVVIGKIRQVNKSATTDLTAKIELDDNLPKNVPAIWDYSTRTIVLNPKVALNHPGDLPFIVTHEAAHGGLLKITNGKPVQAESVADLVAELETGNRISDGYDKDVAALKQVCRMLDKQAQKQGFSSGELYLFALYPEGLTAIFQTLLSVTATDAQAVNNAISLFKTAFPKAKVSYNGERIGSGATHRAANKTIEQE